MQKPDTIADIFFSVDIVRKKNKSLFLKGEKILKNFTWEGSFLH